MMNIRHAIDLLDLITYKPNWSFKVMGEPTFYMQVVFDAEQGPQSGRKWQLSPYMTDSELIQTAFKAILTAEEHETREFFRYRGRAIFGPHYDVNKLHEICTPDNTDVRS